MIIAHISHTGLDALLEMSADDLFEWHEEAIELHNLLNPKSNE